MPCSALAVAIAALGLGDIAECAMLGLFTTGKNIALCEVYGKPRQLRNRAAKSIYSEYDVNKGDSLKDEQQFQETLMSW